MGSEEHRHHEHGHHEHGHHEHGHHEHGHHEVVPIYMDGVEHKIRRGLEKVATIKSVCSVPASDVIELIGEGGKLVPLPDDGEVPIKGDEKFISHKRGGGSS